MCRDTETQRRRDTETQRHKGRETECQIHRDTETQRHRDRMTEAQRRRDAGTHRHIDTEIQSECLDVVFLLFESQIGNMPQHKYCAQTLCMHAFSPRQLAAPK